MDKMQMITDRINSVFSSSKHIKEAKAKKIAHYLAKRAQIETLDEDLIKMHDFNAEVLGLCMQFEKLEVFTKHKVKKIYALDAHKFAPELNTLHFKNGHAIRVRGAVTIDQAIACIIKSMSLEQIKAI